MHTESKCGNGHGPVQEGDLSKVQFTLEEMYLSSLLEETIFESGPLRRTYAQIRLAIVLRAQGHWFSHPSGDGKSTAAEYCCRAIEKEFVGLPTYLLNIHKLPGNALRSIPVRLLSDLVGEECKGETTAVRRRLARRLSEKARIHPLRLVVLILDEAQALREQDLFLLKDLSNDMHKYGVGMFTVSFGESPKMEDVATKTRDSDEGLADRFFNKRCELEPYASVNDWSGLFSEIDKRPFEEFGGRSISEAFMIGNDGKASRLEDQASSFFDALTNYAKTTESQVSIRRAFIALRWWILKRRRGQAKGGNATTPTWQSALTFSACNDATQ